MKTLIKQTLLFAIPCAIIAAPLPAAQMLLTKEQLKKSADKVVVGKVAEVKMTSSLRQKLGGRTDYEIIIEVEAPGQREPGKLLCRAFTMNYSAPLAPDSGTQGNDIPKRGQRVRLYLKAKETKDKKTEYWILTPNGTEILKDAGKAEVKQ